MRIVVFSDSHRSFSALHRVVERQPEAALYLFLGDGEAEFEDLMAAYPEKAMRGVRGNCDWGLSAAANKMFDLVDCGEGSWRKRVFFAHGHTWGVKSGVEKLVASARNAGAEIALYGHTHTGYTGYVDGIYVMNPGSVAQPRDGRASYGIVDITEAGVFTKVIPLERAGL